MNRAKLILYQDNLFKDDKSELTSHQQLIIQRLETAHTFMRENPLTPKKDVVNLLMRIYKIDKAQAYRDIQLTEQLLGNIKNAAKEWIRYKALAMAEETYQMARDEGKLREMAMANKNYNEAGRVKDDDKEVRNFDDMPKLPLEPSSDPSLLRGITPIPNINKRIDEMIAQYNGEIEIEDAVIIEDIQNDVQGSEDE